MTAASAFGAAARSEFKRVAFVESHDSEGADTFYKEIIGSAQMCESAASPLVFVVSAAVDTFPVLPYLFRNYEFDAEARRRCGMCCALLHAGCAARASSSLCACECC